MGICIVGVSLRCRSVEQLARPHEVCVTRACGEEAVVADAMEAAGQDMDEEAADELIGRERHDFLPIAAVGAVILPFEGDAGVADRDQATVGDCHAVCVA